MSKLEQAARQALDALELARGSHGVMLMSNPPHDAWQYRGCDSKLAEAITALREALEQPVSQEPVKREHITDGSPCWCNPELNYKDPETGAEVWVHKEPQ